MGSLRKKARQKPLTERSEKPLGQPPYVNQGVLSAGKLQEGMVMGRTGGKTTASKPSLSRSTAHTPTMWGGGPALRIGPLCWQMNRFLVVWDFVMERHDNEFTELSHWLETQSGACAPPWASHKAPWNGFLVHALSIMITGKISSSLQSPVTWNIHSQIYWLNHSEECCAALLPGLRSLSVVFIFQNQTVCKWKKRHI